MKRKEESSGRFDVDVDVDVDGEGRAGLGWFSMSELLWVRLLAFVLVLESARVVGATSVTN